MNKKLTILKKKFDHQKIKTIENSAKRSMGLAVKHRKAFIETLFYLERTRRFREIKGYENISFAEYISRRFNLSVGTYRSECSALLNFPIECDMVGIGTIARTIRMCGKINVANVVKEIKASGAKSDKDQIDEIIAAYAKPKNTKSIAKRTYSIEEYHKLRNELIDAYATIKQQNEQIGRLKATVHSFIACQPMEGSVITGVDNGDMIDLYHELSKLLTDYENQESPNDPNINWENDFYYILAKIQNNWESINR